MYFWYSRGMPPVERFFSSDSRMYQSDTSSMPSGFTSVHRMIVVVQDPQCFRIGFRVEPVDRLNQLLRAQHLGGVQAAVDPDHGLAVARELPRLLVGEPVGERQLAVRFLDERQLPMVLRRRDDRGDLGPALFRLADVHDHHALGLRVHLLEVVEVLACS